MTNQWNRFVRVHLGSKLISNKELDITFATEESTSTDADTCEIGIFNLSQSTIEAIQVGQLATLEAGYAGDYGTIFAGTIKEVYSKRVSLTAGDIITTVIIINDMSQFLDIHVNKTYPANSKARDIALDMVKMSGLSNVYVDEDETVIDSAITFTTESCLMENIAMMAVMMGFDFFVRQGAVWLTTKTPNAVSGFVLNGNTGLLTLGEAALEDDSDDAYDYDALALLTYKISNGSIVQITPSNGGAMLCRVKECIHRGNGNDYTSAMKLVIL
jgi:hypothetical protein